MNKCWSCKEWTDLEDGPHGNCNDCPTMIEEIERLRKGLKLLIHDYYTHGAFPRIETIEKLLTG